MKAVQTSRFFLRKGFIYSYATIYCIKRDLVFVNGVLGYVAGKLDNFKKATDFADSPKLEEIAQSSSFNWLLQQCSRFWLDPKKKKSKMD